MTLYGIAFVGLLVGAYILGVFIGYFGGYSIAMEDFSVEDKNYTGPHRTYINVEVRQLNCESVCRAEDYAIRLLDKDEALLVTANCN